jgi:hypothetical protein
MMRRHMAPEQALALAIGYDVQAAFEEPGG